MRNNERHPVSVRSKTGLRRWKRSADALRDWVDRSPSRCNSSPYDLLQNRCRASLLGTIELSVYALYLAFLRGVRNHVSKRIYVLCQLQARKKRTRQREGEKRQVWYTTIVWLGIIIAHLLICPLSIPSLIVAGANTNEGTCRASCCR